MEFPRPEYWTEYPFPSPGDLPNPGIELRSPTLQADALTSASPELRGYILCYEYCTIYKSIQGIRSDIGSEEL